MQFIYKGDVSRVIEATGQFVDDKGTQYGADWDKATIPDMVAVVETAAPNDSALRVTGFVIEILDGVPTRVWQTEPIPAGELVEQDRARVRSAILVIEQSITNRRLREAVLSDAGRTWLDSQDVAIAALRAELNTL